MCGWWVWLGRDLKIIWGDEIFYLCDSDYHTFWAEMQQQTVQLTYYYILCNKSKCIKNKTGTLFRDCIRKILCKYEYNVNAGWKRNNWKWKTEKKKRNRKWLHYLSVEIEYIFHLCNLFKTTLKQYMNGPSRCWRGEEEERIQKNLCKKRSWWNP